MLSLARAALENCFITENQVVILTESDLDSGHIYHIFFHCIVLNRIESHCIIIGVNRIASSFRFIVSLASIEMRITSASVMEMHIPKGYSTYLVCCTSATM